MIILISFLSDVILLFSVDGNYVRSVYYERTYSVACTDTAMNLPTATSHARPSHVDVRLSDVHSYNTMA